MAEQTKNLCAQIPESLHIKLREHQEASGKTLAQYMVWLITKFYDYEQGGTMHMDDKRTVAFQVPAELFEQLKEYLKKHKMKQSTFFLNCIQQALSDDQEP